MKMPVTSRIFWVACVTFLLVLFTMFVVRSGFRLDSKTPAEVSDFLDRDADTAAEISDLQSLRNRVGGAGAPSRDGLTELEWINRLFGAIQRGGVWLPITNQSELMNEEGADAEIETPLYITTGSLPFGRVGEEYQVSLEAVGGQQPYHWSVESGELPVPLNLDPLTGQIAGTAEEPESGRFRIRVTDSIGESDIAEYMVAIEPAVRLELVTEVLPPADSGGSYAVILEAIGGMPPYRWSLHGDSESLGSLQIDAQTGALSGTILPDLKSTDVLVRVVVQDQQIAVEKDFAFLINGVLSLEAEPELEPSEDLPVEVDETEEKNGVDGGEKDLEEVLEDSSATVKPLLDSGPGGGRNNDSDASPERAALTAFISLKRIALTWALPPELDGARVRLVRSEAGIPETAESGVVVFEGRASTVVDREISPGLYYYSLFVEGIGERFADVAVRLLPTRDAYPFATMVADQNFLHPAAFQAGRLPGVATGPPQGTGLAIGSADVVSLGAAINDDGGVSAPYGGSLTVGVVDDRIWDGPGADFTVFENVFYVKGATGNLDPNSRFMEPAIVSVSQDGINFRQFPFDFSPRYDAETGELNLRHPYAYSRGFAGINPVLSNGLFPDPTDPQVSGGDSFDIGELGFEWIRFVRVQSTGDRWLVDRSGDVVPHNREGGAAIRGFNKSGFDFDAVAAIWYRKVDSQ